MFHRFVRVHGIRRVGEAAVARGSSERTVAGKPPQRRSKIRFNSAPTNAHPQTEVTLPKNKFKKEQLGVGFGGEAVALDVFVGHAPDGATGGGEEEFFDGDAEEVDAEEIGDVVEAVDEIGVEEEDAEKEEKIEESETDGADEHECDQIAAKVGDN